MTGSRLLWAALLAVTAFAFGGCKDADLGLTAAEAQVEVRLSAAPSMRVAEAQLQFSRVVLIPTDEAVPSVELVPWGAAPRRVVVEREAVAGGVRVASATIPPGLYDRLRISIDRATVRLNGTESFADGSNVHTLFVPGALRSGIDIALDRPLVVAAQQSALLSIEIDLDRSFTVSAPAVDGAARDVKFRPVLRLARGA